MDSENGFLTDTDLAFICGEKEYTGKNAKQTRYERRKAIRERTRQAFRDFSVLYERLDPEERKKIFNVNERRLLDPEAGIDSATRDGIIDTIAFVYQSLEGEPDSPAPSLQLPGFRQIVEQAVTRAETDQRSEDGVPSPVVTVELSIEVTDRGDIDVAYAAEKAARGRVGDLSEVELRALVDSAVQNLNDYALEPVIEAKREQIGLDTDEIREEVAEWFEEAHIDRDESGWSPDDIEDPDDYESVLRQDHEEIREELNRLRRNRTEEHRQEVLERELEKIEEKISEIQAERDR